MANRKTPPPPFTGGSWIPAIERLATAPQTASSSRPAVVEGGPWYSADGIGFSPPLTDLATPPAGAAWTAFAVKLAGS